MLPLQFSWASFAGNVSAGGAGRPEHNGARQSAPVPELLLRRRELLVAGLHRGIMHAACSTLKASMGYCRAFTIKPFWAT